LSIFCLLLCVWLSVALQLIVWQDLKLLVVSRIGQQTILTHCISNECRCQLTQHVILLLSICGIYSTGAVLGRQNTFPDYLPPSMAASDFLQ